jgi:hypothetical protein
MTSTYSLQEAAHVSDREWVLVVESVDVYLGAFGDLTLMLTNPDLDSELGA